MPDSEILRHFKSKREFETMSNYWESEQDAEPKQLFCRLVRAIHSSGLDLYHVNIPNQIRFGLKNRDAQAAASVTGYIHFARDAIYVSTNSSWVGSEIRSIEAGEWMILDDELVGNIEDELEDWSGIPEQFQRNRDGHWPDDYLVDVPLADNASGFGSAEPSPAHSLNKILYGPPGTGKTYATFRRCVEICDSTAPRDDNEVGLRYRELVDEGRVEFVTFHQSYGYEEFVEGLRPQTGSTDSDDGTGPGFRLDPEDGVLKRIAERARKFPARSATHFPLEHRSVFKMGLGNPIAAEEQGIFEECVEGGYALLGWGGNIDWSRAIFSEHEEILRRWQESKSDATGHDSNVKSIHCFRNQLSEGDLIFVPTSQQKFRAVGEVTGPYEFKERSDGIYPHRRNVNWLWIDQTGMPFSEIYDSKIVPQTIYRLRPEILRKDRLMRYIGQDEESPSPQPYVLVIDEINRGNISKVFGEAITIVENDKRSGSRNEISVTLPYSGKPFTLPGNLYILGTMNTADRSIALLDTALRRRFEFEELAPDPEALQEAATASGINLPDVLKSMNERLEWLLDRDHLIGHAWFMGARTKNDVDRIMHYKIIPLLAEYFHEDWSKVRAVLGGGDGFMKRKTLVAPADVDSAGSNEERYRWTVREEFSEEAYRRLIDVNAPQTDAIVDGPEVDAA